MGFLCAVLVLFIVLQDILFLKIRVEILIVLFLSAVITALSLNDFPAFLSNTVITILTITVFILIERILFYFGRTSQVEMLGTGDKVLWMVFGMLFSHEKALLLVIMGSVFAAVWYQRKRKCATSHITHFPAAAFFALGVFFLWWLP